MPAPDPAFEIAAAAAAVREAKLTLDWLKDRASPVTISQQVPDVIARLDAAKIRLQSVLDRNIPPEDFARSVLAGGAA